MTEPCELRFVQLKFRKRTVDNFRYRSAQHEHNNQNIAAESMSSNRKLNFRQSSLICESPKKEIRRNSLRKQASEEITTQTNNYLNNEIKVTVNTKCKVSKNDFPKPKVAWGENDVDEIEQPIIVNKCQEIRKPVRQFTRQCSVEQDSILSCKDDLIDKIRLLLKDEKDIPEKQNINIYLTNDTKSSHPENTVPKYHHNKDINVTRVNPTSDTGSANLFQFRKPVNRNIEERNYNPSNVKDTRREPPNILVTPITEKIEEIDGSVKNEPKNIITNTSQPINNVIIRPSTAASRRDLFKKRTNSAFHSIVKDGPSNRPPLQRSSSAPIRPDHTKSKFLATKRKLKKRDSRSAKKGNPDQNVDGDKDSQGSNKSTSPNASEIETMVSLVSPAASDVEEIPEIETEDAKNKTRNISPKKLNPITKKDESVPKISTLRKVVKQVSFQQSSIHAIRNFSAGFPGRKHSIVTSSLMLSNGANLKRTNTAQKVQEKRVTGTAVSDDDERVPKRPMTRSRSAHLQTVNDNNGDTDRSITPLPEDHPLVQPNISINIELKLPEDMDEGEDDLEEIKIVEPLEKSTVKKLEDKEEKSEDQSQDGQDFSTPKEKECWNLYLKMSNKGVKVNYDTLLRGMLTPTEYRKRRQSLAVTASIDNDAEQNTEAGT